MKLIFSVLLSLLSYNTQATYQADKSPTPSWVKNINTNETEILDENSSYQYLLIDLQKNLPKQAIYRHYSIKILNAEGIQTMSDINISYDPSYQKLEFHKVLLIREGSEIDKLKTTTIQNIQRETNMERSLYDGSLTAIINLSDVREGDIIEYSYTTTGLNPVNKGHYATTLYQQYNFPVNKIYQRLITDSKASINYKLFEGANKPKIEISNDKTEYLWESIGLDYTIYESNTPYWYDPQKRISYSTFNSWSEVVNWALPLYNTNNSGLSLNKQDEKPINKEDEIIKSIRMVQDEIRYLGFESGISAYKPNSPNKVLNQRYGDCKDKSLLLVTLLKDQGIEAYPVLVNTLNKSEISNQLPSNTVFDHCIVNLEFEGKQYFIDPTISSQGGNLKNIATPNYKKGLRIKNGESNLIDIQSSNNSEISINETITIDSIGKGASFLIETTYKGVKADYMRSYFNSSPKETIKRDFTNYYSNIYPGIESIDNVKFTDFDRNIENIVTVKEYYKLNDLWLDAENDSYIYTEIYPLVLESYISYPQTTSVDRSMPYYLGENLKFHQKTSVYLPEEWSIEPSTVSIEGNGFSYKNIVKGYGKNLSVEHNYELNKEIINAKELVKFQKDHEDIQNQLSYFLTYNQNLNEFKFSWVSIIIILIAITIGIYFSIKIFKEYNPKPYANALDLSIGGWLVLPAIGLTLTPIFMLIDLITETSYYNKNSWINFIDSGLENYNILIGIYGLELFYNYLFLIFSILLIVLFYKRRTSIPQLMTIFYISNFLFILLDYIAFQFFTDLTFTNAEISESYNEITRAFIGSVIWIPYFNISKRVKNTFCKINSDVKNSAQIISSSTLEHN
ncbi:DUF3857 domain-containing protein [Cellulophaga baltica]|uniref:DUF3857 domain-containing protein n=1 Tax=Cellulophaga TaxID=104264 RepID=UPI001C06C3B9|nr:MULTISPECIES: DUF3857 domain-containing protein [Cellulophaga]MBU2995545.1 DUF3857 domain-containing protein [Cellulophaga baltica]MDO6766939.1 DUF3857 domain-containing protein [Cellulophaga sp. 1_MG-2023]